MWPKVPENISSLSIDELKAWRDECKAAVIAGLKAGLTGEERDTLTAYQGHLDAAKAVLADKMAAAVLEDETDPDPVVTPPVKTDDDDQPKTGEDDDETKTDDVDPDAAGKTVTASGSKVITTTGLPTKAVPAKSGRLTTEYLRVADDVEGKSVGDTFDSWGELAMAAVKRAGEIGRGNGKKYTIAKIIGDYPEDRKLGDSLALNLAKFEPEEMMAALCAPATPYYGLACMNTTRRPVFNSLPQFQAPRFKVSVMSSPSLSDITTGVGLWTAADDADSNAEKEACQTITCNDPTTYTAYGVYRCLTVKNMLAMSYPELVEAWLNRLAASHARLAEQQLLAGIYAGTTELNVEKLGYGASTTIIRTILQYIALYQETQRWDDDGEREMWAPRWLQTAIRMDLFSRRNTSGNRNLVPTQGEVDAMFRDAGVNPHWFLDTPAYATAIPAVGSGGFLNRLPSDVQIMLAPRGKFAVIDRGELNIGVTANNIYRDNDSNAHNEFTYFFENFEGIVNTTSCPAHTLDIPICANGVQVDDQLVDCNGVDMGTYQS